MIKQVTLAAAFTLISFAAAFAETPEERQACTDDAFRVCGDAIPDQDRVFACLARNYSSLTPLCQRGMAPYVVAQSPPTQPTKGKAKTKAKKKNARGGPVSLSPE